MNYYELQKEDEKKIGELKNYLFNGMTLAISGMDSIFYPKKLIDEIRKSGVKNLTVINIEYNDAEDFGIKHLEGNEEDIPGTGNCLTSLVLNGQVDKIITSHLGCLGKIWSEHIKTLELLPMDILVQKMVITGMRLPGPSSKDYTTNGGFYVDKNYAMLYRDKDYIEKNSFTFSPVIGDSENKGSQNQNDKTVVLERPFDIDLGIICVDEISANTLNCSWDGSAFNCIELAKASKNCVAEYHKMVENVDTKRVDLLGQYVSMAIKSPWDEYRKTVWY